MKIAFFWTWEFSKNILCWLLNFKDLEVVFVVSQPDKPVGRKKQLVATPVKLLAESHKIRILQPCSLKNNEEIYEQAVDIDFFVVVAYGKIIPQRILDIPIHWSINLHGSLLPLYRWASPVQEAIKNWDTLTWLTTMYMSAWMDEGDMLMKQEITIGSDDTQEHIFLKFEEVWAELIYSTLTAILETTIKPIEQDSAQASYCSKIQKTDGLIDFQSLGSADIYNMYRAYTPWPGIYVFFHWKKISIESCTLEKGKNNTYENKIGEVLKTPSGQVWIVCSDKKILIVMKVKLEWKKMMNILDFVNGNPWFLDYRF